MLEESWPNDHRDSVSPPMYPQKHQHHLEADMARQKESGYRWVILAVNFVFLAFAYASLTTWSVAIPELSKSFSLTSASAQARLISVDGGVCNR